MLQKYTLFFFVMSLLFVGGGIHQLAAQTYPKIDTSYTNEVIQNFIKQYNRKKDSVGLAYSYGVFILTQDFALLDRKNKVEIFKKFLSYYPLIKRKSQRDYLSLSLKLTTFLSVDKNGVEKSLNLCDEAILFARKNKDYSLEFIALINKIDLLRQTGKNKDLINLERDFAKSRSKIKIIEPILNIIYNHHMAGILNKKKDYIKSCYYANQSLEESLKYNTIIFIELSYLLLAQNYRLLNNHNKAFFYLKKVNQILINNNDQLLISWLHEEYAQLFESLKEYKKSSYHWKIYNLTVKQLELNRTNTDNFNTVMVEFIENEIKVDNENLKLQNQLVAKESELKSNFAFNLIVLIVLMAIALFLGVLWYLQKVKNLENEKSIAQLLGQEKEREHISKNLHDLIGGTILSVKNQLPPSINNYQQLVQHLNEIYETIRTVSHTLTAEAVQIVGLTEACTDFIRLIDKQNKIIFETYGYANTDLFPAFYTTMCFRCIQELLLNSLKHSQATKITLELFYSEDYLLVSVEDNGIGYDTKKYYTGIGLKNIKSRIATMNGSLEVNSNPQFGSTTLIKVPM